MTQMTPTDTTNDLQEALGEEEQPGALSAKEIAQIKKKSISGVFSFFLRTAVLQGIGLVSALILSIFLGPEDFAVYGIVTQIIALLIFFSDVGLAASLIQKKQRPSNKDYQTAFTVQQILSWAIFLIVLTLLKLNLLGDKIGADGRWVLLALGLSFPLATFKTIPSIILERKLDFNRLVLPQIFEQIVFHGILIVLAWKGFGVLAYAYAIVARSLVGVLAMQIIQPWKIKLTIDRASLKDLLSFGVKFQLNDLLARIKDQLYFLALGAYLPLQDFGYLQWSKNWSMYPYNLTVSNVMSITFPTFSRLQGNRDLLKKAIEKSIYFISLAIFPVLVGMSVFIAPLTTVFSQYHKWQPAIFSFVLFALSVAWSAISTPLINSLNAIGKINQTLKLMVLWTVSTWVITPVLLWRFGFNGVALAALLISFTSVLSIKMVKKYVPVDIWAQVWVQLLAAATMAGVGILGLPLWSSSVSNLFLGILLLGAIYLLVILLLARDRLFRELRLLKRNL